MNHLRYALHDGHFVDHILVTPPTAERRHFERVSLRGNVNEWLSKGFSIHENPFRKRFAEARKISVPVCPSISAKESQAETSPISEAVAGDTLEANGSRFGPLEPYFPFGNINVDRSSFYYTPAALRRYAIWSIDAPHDTQATMRLWTCGAVTLWIDGILVTDFVPFTRNMVKSWSGMIGLKQGITSFCLCHDDLAERDTDFYFRIALEPCAGVGLRWPESCEPSIALPFPDATDTQEILRTEKALSKWHTERECTSADMIVLSPCPILLQDSSVSHRERRNADSGWMSSPIPVEYSFVAGEVPVPETTLPGGTFDAAGIDPVTLETFKGDVPVILRIVMERRITGIRIQKIVSLLIADDAPESGENMPLGTRKNLGLERIAAVRSDDAYTALAKIAIGRKMDISSAEASIRTALDKIDSRYDCADFLLVSVIHMYMDFADRLSSEILERIRTTLRNFRYWSDEPGDDVMWFFSENHALLFHSCEYFAGTLLADDVFTNSGMTGREHCAKAIGLLDQWFERFFSESITEWNSSAYIPVDIHGLCALHSLANLPELRAKARRALDILFGTLAMYSFDGVIEGTFGRSYEKELRGNLAAGTTGLLWIGFGHGRMNASGLACTEFCLSSYVPPASLVPLIRRGEKSSKAIGLLFSNTQGWRRHVNCCLYKTPLAMLSTAIDFKPGKPGYQEHIVHAALSKTAQCWINHPGETSPGGSGRPSYWAGNGVLPRAIQYRNLSIILFGGIDGSEKYDPVVDWTHAYLPLMHFDEYLILPDCAVLRKGGSFMGLNATNGLQFVTEGETAGREVVSPGLKNAWLILVEDDKHFRTLSNFGEYFQKLSFHMHDSDTDPNSPVITLAHPEYGFISVPWHGDITRDGSPMRFGSKTPQGMLELW